MSILVVDRYSASSAKAKSCIAIVLTQGKAQMKPWI
jgi:hypothetical protein